MKNILLLGSRGFIGRNLLEYFEAAPELYAVDHPSHRELDLSDGTSVRSFLGKKRYDVIINAAICNPRGSGVPAGATELSMDLAMFHNLALCHDLYGKMLYFGSGAEFNKAKSICSVSEDGFTNGVPETEYGLAKYTIGRLIENSDNIYSFRIFGLFGKYEDWRKTFISGACCKAIKGVPITIRQNVFFDYLYIDDFCRAVEWFIDTDAKHHTYNVGSGRRIDLVSIAKLVNEICGNSVPIYVCCDGLGNEYTASNARLLRECPGYCRTDMPEAISKLAEYYREIEGDIDLYSLLYSR